MSASCSTSQLCRARAPYLQSKVSSCGHVVSPLCSRATHLSAPVTTRQLQHGARTTGHRQTQASAASTDKEVYSGVYGPWSVEREDLYEVWGYRVGLSVTAAAFIFGAVHGLLPSTGDTAELKGSMEALLNPACLAGAVGFGVSLQLIHIYVTFLKRTLQVFWALGLAGGLYLMATQDTSVPVFVEQHPWAVWLVGPMFAALTGVAFKEGVCYRRFEAAGLFFGIPALLLGHLSQVLPLEAEQVLLVADSALLIVFASRKYTQAVKDDIGDKSVFTFMALSPEEQEQILASRPE